MSGIVLGKVIGNPGGAAVKVALNPDEFKAEIQLFLQAFRHADMHTNISESHPRFTLSAQGHSQLANTSGLLQYS